MEYNRCLMIPFGISERSDLGEDVGCVNDLIFDFVGVFRFGSVGLLILLYCSLLDY